jgi:predicted metal-binding membrane protein
VGVVLAPFLGSWTLMMAAMMLPSAMPMILLHRRGIAGQARMPAELRSVMFVGAYILVWATFGVGVWLVTRLSDALLPMGARAPAVAAILLLAGLYQFTPLKVACLRVCRSPMDFLLTHWYPGVAGEMRLGLEHGLYCLGCCWALMVVFVGAGAMGLLWAALIAVAVFAEKVLPRGVAFGRLMGAGLVAGALLVVARPEIAQFLSGKI